MYLKAYESFTIKGERTSQLPHAFSSFLNFLDVNQPLFIMYHKSITVFKPHMILIQRVCSGCYDIGSEEYDVCYRLFMKGNYGCFQEIRKCKTSLFYKGASTLAISFPPKAKSFMSIVPHIWEDKDPEIMFNDPFDDIDYELMFSKTQEVIVGSYRCRNSLVF